MVYSRRSTTLSLINAAAVYLLFVGTVSSTRAEQDGSGVCGVSDTNLKFGIRAFDDPTCAVGGLGCFDDHCRYCKVLETPKSSAYFTCDELGVDFPTMAPLTVDTTPCEISEGDAAVGIATFSDDDCLYGGLGCYSDHCRFCKVNETVQSSIFLPCSDFNSTALVTTPTDASDGSDAQLSTSSAASGSNVNDFLIGPSGSSSTKTPRSHSSGSTLSIDGSGSDLSCPLVAARGDLLVGVDIITDGSCSAGVVGCIDDLCRFCKTKTTLESEPYEACDDDSASNEDIVVSAAMEVQVTLSDVETPDVGDTPPELIALGSAGAAAAAVMTALALRRKLRQVAISAIRANPIVDIDDGDHSDDEASKPPTPSSDASEPAETVV